VGEQFRIVVSVAGEFALRSDVAREGVARLVDERRRWAIGNQIIAGYDRLPRRPTNSCRPSWRPGR